MFTGDARHLDYVLPPDLLGQAALVVTSPPYGPSTHGHVTTDHTGVHKRNHLYGDLLDRGNLAKSAAATGVYSARNALGHSPGTCTAPLAPSPAYLVVDGTVEWLGAQP